MKIRTKVIVLFSAISIAYIVSFALYVSYFTKDSLQTKFYHRLEENATIVGNHIIQNDAYNNKVYYEVTRKYLRQLSEGKDYLLRIVKGHTDLRYKPDLPLPDAFYEEAIVKGKAQFLHHKTSYVALFFVDSLHKENLLVISAGVDEYGHDEQQILDHTLISGGSLAIILVVLLSFYFANRLLAPIKAINKELTQVDISNLNKRVKNNYSNDDDEIGILISNFNAMMKRLDISVKSQQSFIGNASHSLRTPLTIIGGEAELALHHLDKNHEAYYSVEAIAKHASKMNLIINNLLLLSRTGFEGKIESKQWIRIDELLYDVQKSEKSMNPDCEIFLDFSHIPEDSSEMNIFVNPDLFYIAFSNIVSNACKYGDKKMVTISLVCHENLVVVKISDHGIGIPLHDQPHIFDSFYRASNVGAIYGNGLGLVLAKHIFELHHAILSVSSIENKGTSVSVYIPK
ncbi:MULTISPECIES: sensor histidine kinase [Sphingobacterium]|uniref:histidine kinase n=1 Tax=Sphingobacterium kitahiroshimense TaxID=470446 RepID=A0ABV0BPD6_9SPHI|nr:MULTISPECIES: HAMP domain-containing sensor histidine kinase [unclassified Sphingobacterium]MBB2954182.1 signal transduction histidine kinase [Sphingobacterium sp. JUb56]MCS3553526.1 signal transduction histidine kinase [Sphingobacterium sp. JUb21]QQD15465.1 HAMP domain-containing histidine kinase [Sphingobacterium sp. UDSM-2020]TCR09264.1 signal transduction histidine kinase [Sphingobacterium sp. JUb20]